MGSASKASVLPARCADLFCGPGWVVAESGLGGACAAAAAWAFPADGCRWAGGRAEGAGGRETRTYLLAIRPISAQGVCLPGGLLRSSRRRRRKTSGHPTAASRRRAGEEKRVRAWQLRAAGSSCAALCLSPPAHWSDKNTAGAAGALRPDSILTGPAPFLVTTPHRPRQGPRLFPTREHNTHRTGPRSSLTTILAPFPSLSMLAASCTASVWRR